MIARFRAVLLSLCLMLCSFAGKAQVSAEQLFYQLRSKVESVNDYVADIRMRIDVSFMKIPPLSGRLYFKKPGKLKLERNGGIAILPRKTMNITLNNMIPEGGATVIDAGYDTVGKIKVRVIKVVPNNEQNDIVLTKIWVDEAHMLALRTESTTRDNGTMKMDLEYGRYANLALPDKVTLFIDVKEYKVPKGVTMDYDGVDELDAARRNAKGKQRKGRIQIIYASYRINTGLSDAFFAENKR
jgi:outer membrane lipoprotein-sorting protein